MDALQQVLVVNVQVVNQSVRQILVRVDVIQMLAVNYQVGAEVLILVEDVIIAKSEQIVVLEELLVALVLAEVPIVVLVMPHLTSAKIILNLATPFEKPQRGCLGLCVFLSSPFKCSLATLRTFVEPRCFLSAYLSFVLCIFMDSSGQRPSE